MCVLFLAAAFTVTAPANHTFANIISNSPNGFNRSLGRFTCSVPGIYFFTFYVQTINNVDMNYYRLELIRNGNQTGNYLKFDRRYSGYPKNGGSNSLALRLGVGETVELRLSKGYGHVENNIYQTFARRSSFSGMLFARGNLVTKL